MTYTFIGEKDYIQKEISKISKTFNQENIARYNLEEININKVIEDLNTISLFGDKLILASSIDKIENPDSLIEYLNNEGSNTLILISFKELDKRKKITKVLKEKTKYKEYLNYNIENVIKENLKDYKMSQMAINLLISYCSNNLSRIENELEKLMLYKAEEKEITTKDIEKLVKKSLDSTIFNLIDKINEKDKDKVFKIYNELLEEGETEEKIMYTIANHYRLLFQISEKIKSLSDDEIIKEYKMHPYRLTKLKEQLNLIVQDDILKILKNLSDIDINVKKGKIDIKTAMFLFFEGL